MRARCAMLVRSPLLFAAAAAAAETPQPVAPPATPQPATPQPIDCAHPGNASTDAPTRIVICGKPGEVNETTCLERMCDSCVVNCCWDAYNNYCWGIAHPLPPPVTPAPPPPPPTQAPAPPGPGITTQYKYAGPNTDGYCPPDVHWFDPKFWDPAPPTAADTAVFGDWSLVCDYEAFAPPIESSGYDGDTRTSSTIFLGALHLENTAFGVSSGSISVAGGVTLRNATLRIGGTGANAGTRNAADLRPDPAAAAKGFHACADLPTGFQPRVCGAGPVTVDKTSVLSVSSQHASVFAPVSVAAGGAMLMNSGSYVWKTVTNEGTITTAGDVYWLGELRNEAGGVVSVGGGFIFDLWAYNAGAATVPAKAEVTTITNAGLIILIGGAQLQGTQYNYGGEIGEYVGTMHNTRTGRLLANTGEVAYVGFDFQLVNGGEANLTRAVLRRGVRNLGRMRLADSDVAASSRVANHAGAELALHRTELHGALDNAGAVRVTGTNANRWGGAVSNTGGLIAVDAADVFATKLRSDRGVVELTNGAQINHQSTGGGDYCWESVWKYCGCSDCDDPSCRWCSCCNNAAAGAAPLAALPPLTSRFARNTTFPSREPAHPPGAGGCAAAEEYAFTRTELRGDGSGSAVFAGELRLRGDAALHVAGARVFTVAEQGAAAVSGGGELVVGAGGAVHLGIDAALGAGGRVAVRRGGVLGVDPHARVTFGNHTVHVAPGGTLHVDGDAHFAPGAALRVCGARSGSGRVSGADPRC